MEAKKLDKANRRAVPTKASVSAPELALDQFLSLHDVMILTSYGKTAIYGLIAKNKFPRPIQLSRTKVAWSARDIARWQQDQRAHAA